MTELNQELLMLARRIPSTDEGIEAMDLISRAIANVTNERFKRETIILIRRKFAQYFSPTGVSHE